ncbi:MAG: HesA/MoeB/ThiF family protein [Deltaproteobacteria bacterium]|nr:HesA/MoeB/ThiF family protein [Deltaproteobacteria bacterium]
MFALSERELGRYDRQLRVPTFTREVQAALKASRVVLLGLGGTGCPAALYLVAAGVGHLRVVDHDLVQLDNLNRQVLYGEEALGRKKVDAGCARLRSLNGEGIVEALDGKVTAENVGELVAGAAFVIDALDRVEDRLAVNRACLRAGIPANHAFVHGFRGEVVTVAPGRGACLRCLVDPSTPPSLSGVGTVVGVAAGVVGLFQATDALKHLTGLGDTFPGVRILVDLLDFSVAHLDPCPEEPCPECGGPKEVRP